MKSRMFFIAIMIPWLAQAAESFASNPIQGPFVRELRPEENPVPHLPAPQLSAPQPNPPVPAPPNPLPPPSECRPSPESIFGVFSDEISKGDTKREAVGPTLPGTKPGPRVVVIDDIINIGEKIWKIVEANKPVVEIKRASASAVPSGITCWMDLTSWQIPVSRGFVIFYKNSLGVRVVSFKYAVNYTYGGALDGIGSYLANVSIVPIKVNALLGYQVNAEVSIPSTINMGTRSHPVAGMQIELKFQMDSPLNRIERTEVFFVTGEGELTKIDATET